MSKTKTPQVAQSAIESCTVTLSLGNGTSVDKAPKTLTFTDETLYAAIGQAMRALYEAISGYNKVKYPEPLASIEDITVPVELLKKMQKAKTVYHFRREFGNYREPLYADISDKNAKLRAEFANKVTHGATEGRPVSDEQFANLAAGHIDVTAKRISQFRKGSLNLLLTEKEKELMEAEKLERKQKAIQDKKAEQLQALLA